MNNRGVKMKRIIGTRASGKTVEIVKQAIQSDENREIIFVTGFPDYIRGIVCGLDTNKITSVISYKEFIEKIGKQEYNLYTNNVSVYIDEIDGFLCALNRGIKGYTLGIDHLITEV